MIELVLIGAGVALATILSQAQTARRSRAAAVAAKTLATYARERGYAFVGAKSPRVEGTRDEIPFVVDFYRLGDQLRTRISARPVHPTRRITIVQRTVFARALARTAATPASSPHGSDEADTGHRAVDAGEVVGTTTTSSNPRARQEPSDQAAFARVYEVRSSDGAASEDVDAPLVDDVLAQALLVLDDRDEVALVADGAQATVAWNGIETDPAKLDAARDASVIVARRRRSSLPYR